MSSSQVQDPAVTERRLRPIYDCLEVGNNKKALQEAEKFLKKYPGVQCARALKALVLLRIGRDAEADAMIEKLFEEEPRDESTLLVMTVCYKEQEEWDKICQLYTAAAKKNPGNEDILSHLFMAHVRVGNFQGQQTVAMQLYKVKPKNPYYFWATMSVVLKALRGPDSSDPVKSKLMLALAQRMIDKQIDEKKLDAEQEAQLYLSVLNYQSKFAEALAFMDSELGKTLYPGAPVTLRIDLLKNLKRWTELNSLLKELLRDNRERWDYYKEYIDNVLELHKIAALPSENTEGTAKPFETCLDFLTELIETGDRVIRGPYLARLQMHKVMRDNQLNAESLLGDLLELLVEYFRLFGEKPCCTNDIVLFLGGLETAERQSDLNHRLLQESEITPTALPKNKEQMQKHIVSLQISRICGAHALATDHLTALYTAFSLHYEHGMTAFGMGLLPTDLGPSDSYALLAVHVMYDVAMKLQSSEPLVEALCLLNYLLSNSPSNFHAKLLCLQIYHRLGCGWGAHETYERLDVKNVQLDSMGYLHCAQLPICGIPSIAKPLYDSTLKFFTASYKESLEFLAMCYKFGSFSKLQEFMDFRDRLSNSLHYALVSAETLISEMVCMSGTAAQNVESVGSFNLEPKKDRLDWAEMTDNRDLTVIVQWDLKSADGTNSMEIESFRQDLELLKVRSMVLRVVGACIDVYDPSEERASAIQTLTELRPRFGKLLADIRALDLKPVSGEFLASLLPSRLHGILALPYETFFDNLIQLVLVLESGSDAGENVATALEANLVDIESRLCGSISRHNTSSDLLWNRKTVQETITNCLELFALCTLVFSTILDKYTNLASTRTNKKSKQKQLELNTVTDRDRLATITKLVSGLRSKLQKCDDALVTWSQPICPDNIADRIASMSLNPHVEQIVQTTVKESHNMAVKELRAVIKEKLRQLRVARD